MDLAKLHLLNGGFDRYNWDLTDGNNCLKLVSYRYCCNWKLLRWIYTVSVFRPFFAFLLFREKVCAVSSAFLYFHIRTNQTVTYWKKFSEKKNFVKGCSSSLKDRSYRSYTTYLNKIFIYVAVYLVWIWTYKNVDRKAHAFSRKNKYVKNRTKTNEKRMLCKLTFRKELVRR